jgi:hypothetical protein
VISNSAGSVTSANAVVSAPVVVVKPAITTQPLGANLNTGTSATLSVTASGSSPLAYQWKKDGGVIPNATTSSLSVKSAGSYTVTVTNKAGSITSQVAVVKTPLPLANLAGVYQGLIVPATTAQAIDLAASLSASVSTTGSVSGRITRRAGTPQSFTGKVDSFGNLSFSTSSTAALPILDGTATLGTLSMEILPTKTGRRLIGKVTSTVAGKTVQTASLSASPVAVPAANLSGAYTALFQQVEAQSGSYPDGDGHASFSISSSGLLLTGKLADGSPITASLKISEDASCPLFIPLYSGKGLISGNIRFDITQAKTDATSSDMRWFKSRGVTSPANYLTGWSNGIKVDFVASKYDASKGFGLANTATTTLKFSASGADLPALISSTASLSAANALSAPSSSPIKLKPLLETKSGAITGSFTPQGGSAAVGFSGVVIQKAGYASGFFLNNGKSGVVQLTR